jgi:hypothetical protein
VKREGWNKPMGRKAVRILKTFFIVIAFGIGAVCLFLWLVVHVNSFQSS